MKKTVLTLLLVLALLLPGCTYIWPTPESSQPTTRPTDTFRRYEEEYQSSWCYRYLDERLQACYGAVYTAVRERAGSDETVLITDSATKVQTSYNGLRISLPKALRSREEAQKLYTAFTWDHPQFFYVGNTYSYEGYRAGGVDYYDVFCLVFTMDAAKRTKAEKQMEQAVGELLTALPAGLDAFETELFLHDRLLERCVYHKEAAQDKFPAVSFPNAFTVYGALVEGKAVCEGYSRSMQLLMQRAGLECTLASGFDKEHDISHMWNVVTIDGHSYHLDATWDDGDGYFQHTFFNLTTDEIEQTHRLDGDNIGVDTCTATEANYYYRTGKQMEINNADGLAQVVAEYVRKGVKQIEFRFSSRAFGNALYYFERSSWVKQTVNEQLAGTKLQMWNYVCSANETYRTIVLYEKR